MRPTDVLKNEHRVIEQVLDCLEKIADQANSSEPLDWSAVQQIVDFFRNFADRCHHGKEEICLFPLLESRGFSRQFGPTGVMLNEHDEGRGYLNAMAAAADQGLQGDPQAVGRFLGPARNYVALLREHIRKEDHCLFPMADQALSEIDQRSLLRSFEAVELQDVAPDEHQKYLGVANALADRFGVCRGETPSESTGCCHHGHI